MHTTGKTKVLFASEVNVRYIFLSYDILTTGRYSQIADEIADIILVKGASLRQLSGDRIYQPYTPYGVHPKKKMFKIRKLLAPQPCDCLTNGNTPVGDPVLPCNHRTTRAYCKTWPGLPLALPPQFWPQRWPQT